MHLPHNAKYNKMWALKTKIKRSRQGESKCTKNSCKILLDSKN